MTEHMIDPATGLSLDVPTVHAFLSGQVRHASSWLGNAVLLTRADDATDDREMWDVSYANSNSVALANVTTWPIVDGPAAADTMVDIIRRLARNLDTAYSNSRDTHRALETFKGRVREVAIEAHLDGNFCENGLNEALETLGLDSYHKTHEVSVTITFSATVQGDDEDDARDTLKSHILDMIDTDGTDEISDIDTDTRGRY